MKNGRLLLGILTVAAIGSALVFNQPTEREYTPRTPLMAQGAQGAAEYLHSLRANPITGEVDVADVVAAREQLAAMPNGKTLNLQWESLGPANAGGRARAILIDKDSSNIILAASVSGGMYRSRTGGSSWESVSPPGSNLAVVSVAQTGNGDIYYGTGEWPFIFYGGNGASSTPAFIGGGIYKSTDGGKTFAVLPSTVPTGSTTSDGWSAVGDLEADPNNPTTIYAATAGGLRRSTDGGSTWTVVLTGFTRDFTIDVNGNLWVDNSSRLMFSSTGDPGSFTEISSGSGVAGTLPRTQGRQRIAVSPQDPNYIYVVQLNGSALRGVYRSIDGGSTWSQIGQKGAQFDPFCSGTRCQGTYDLLFGVSAKDKDRIWMGGITTWTWYQGQWDQVNTTFQTPGNPFYIHADVHEVIQDPKNPDIVWVLSDGGLHKSSDHGVTWAERNLEFRTLQFYKFGVSQDRFLIGGTQDNGTQLLNNSQNFENYSQRVTINGAQADGGEADISWLSPKVMFGENQWGDLGRSENNGESFVRFYEGNMQNGGLGFTPFNAGYSNWIMPYELYETIEDPLSQDSVLFYAFPASQSLGFGNGSDVNFANVLERPYDPAQFVANTFRIESGALTVVSDAAGNLSGDGTGNFDASTGAYTVTFNQAPLAEIVISCSVSYPSGSALRLNSNIGGLPFDVTLPTTVGPDDSLMIQDPVQSMMIVGLNSYDAIANSGVWMTREVHDFSKTPNWWKIGQMNNQESPLSMTITTDGDVCYIGTNQGRLYRYENLTQARDDSADILFTNNPVVIQTVIRTFGRPVTDVAVDPNSNDRVVVTLGSYGFSDYVYYSTNATSASPVFTSKTGNLPAMPVYSAVFDKNNPASVVIGTEMGAFSLTNIDQPGSAQWANENNGLPTVPVFEIEQYRTNKLSPSDTARIEEGDIYLATHGRGFYRTGTTVVDRPISVEENELDWVSHENLNVYPNPSKGVSKIDFTLEGASEVNLTVRDLNGRQMYAKDLGRMTSGDHTIDVSFETLTSGVYVVSLKMDNQVQTAKVILQK